jgi:hypothetical protein
MVDMLHRPLASLVVLLLASAPVAAQSIPPAERTRSFGAAAEWAYPFRSSINLDATPGIDASYREWLRPHLAIEIEFGSWRESHSGTYRLAGYQVPPEQRGEPVFASYTSHTSWYNVGVNVLGRLPIGRAAITAGGGPGLFFDRYDSASPVNGAVQTWSFTSKHVGAQTLAVVELRVIDRVTAFGGVRAELRDIDALITYPTAGVRINF